MLADPPLLVVRFDSGADTDELIELTDPVAVVEMLLSDGLRVPDFVNETDKLGVSAPELETVEAVASPPLKLESDKLVTFVGALELKTNNLLLDEVAREEDVVTDVPELSAELGEPVQ